MYLTRRSVLLLLLAAPIIGAGTWLPTFEWVAAVYVALTLLTFGLDWYQAGPIGQFEMKRRHDTKLSLGADNLILLQLHNRGPANGHFPASGRAAGCL